jgi:hypothetical protein
MIAYSLLLVRGSIADPGNILQHPRSCGLICVHVPAGQFDDIIPVVQFGDLHVSPKGCELGRAPRDRF